MKDQIRKIAEGSHLTRDEAAGAMRTIMQGDATGAQIAAFLVALKLKGEQTEELAGFVSVMREMSVKVRLDDPDAVDLCGTGGDGTGTFNISTVASFVVAGAGATVAKHGNRSVSSACGSADLLQELGVNIDIAPERVGSCINTVGIGFLFAPLFHPAMRHAAKTRSELGIKTCFNLLGPLTNPAGVERQLTGAFSPRAAELLASVFSRLDPAAVMVVHSEDGLDEISLSAPTRSYTLARGKAAAADTISHASFGMERSAGRSVSGGDAAQNARIAMRILSGEKGPDRNIVLANAAAALTMAGKAATFTDGVALGAEAIDSGNARRKLERLREYTCR